MAGDVDGHPWLRGWVAVVCTAGPAIWSRGRAVADCAGCVRQPRVCLADAPEYRVSDMNGKLAADPGPTSGAYMSYR